MPKKTRDYRSWRQQKLTDPEIAEGYLNSALEDSPQMFLKALLNVTQAQQNVATVAQKAGIKRETIYRAFSENGNPTLDTLNSVLQALGLRIQITSKKRPDKISEFHSGENYEVLIRVFRVDSRPESCCF